MPPAVRFGVNYTPSEGWFHHWLDFDLDSVRADLDSIAALGLDHVRVFPLWPYFQPNRSLIRPRAVEQLVALVDAAGERGLDVNVDGLQGHLSSFDFLPAWTRTWHRRNLFTDPDVLDGQAAYLRTLAAALADRPNFLGMTLGNEVNQFSALATAEGVRPQSMATTLAALDRQGLIRRSPDPEDGRRQLVTLTDAGRLRVEGDRQAREEWLARALQDRYTEDERRTVLEGLALLERLTQP